MQIIEAKHSVNVVACVLKKKEKILITSRPLDKSFSGIYEFPGGKVEETEYFIEALAREIYEELGVCLNFNKTYYLKSSMALKKNKIKLHFFLCLSWTGQIISREKQSMQWVIPSELKKYNLLESNEKFINFLTGCIFPTAN